MTFWNDLRFGLRALRKNPLVTSLAIASLALAIAGNTAVFSLINAFLYRPLPYEAPERIAFVTEQVADDPTSPPIGTSAANFSDWRDRAQSFSTLGAMEPAQYRYREGDTSEPIAGARATPGFFTVLTAGAVHGRLLLDEETVDGRDAVVVLDHGFWTRRFAGDAGIVGQTLMLDDRVHTVVGILPEAFEFLGPGIELWTPMIDRADDAARDQRTLNVVGRLRDGVTMPQAKAEVRAIGEALATEHPSANRGYAVLALDLRHEIPNAQSRQLMGLLQGAVIFVLLIACANIANLLLVRAQDRRREVALRTVLGAGRGRILRQLSTESVILAGCGGVLGMALGWAGTQLMGRAFADRLPSFWMPVLDGRVVAFTVGVTVLAGLLFGLAPAVQTLRLDLVGVLKDAGGRGLSGGVRRRLLSRGLVVAEIALSLVLIGGGSVMIRSFLAFQHSDPGFEPKGLLTIPVAASETRYPDDEQTARLYQRVQRQVAAVPGVVSATLTSALPQGILSPTDRYRVDERTVADDRPAPRATWISVAPTFLASMKIPLVRGRFFTAADRGDQQPVVAINRSLAARWWPDGDAVGERIHVLGAWREIVGVVDDTRQVLISQLPGADALVYLPSAQRPQTAMVLVARTAGDPYAQADAVRSALLAIDPDLTLGQAQTLEDVVDQLFVGAQVFNVVLIGFGTLALFLASLGTYGVLAYNVAQRRHEIGVRMAIGAGRAEVLRMVTRQGLTLGVLGLLLGVPGLVAVTRLITTLLANQTPVEPTTVVFVGAMLLVVTVFASFLPAHRAATIDPTEALRAD